MQEVRPLAGDPLVDLRHPGLCLAKPVRRLQPEPLREGFALRDAGGDLGRFELASHRSLVAAQALDGTLVRIERRDPLPGVEGGEVRHPTIDAAGLRAALERLGFERAGDRHVPAIGLGAQRGRDRSSLDGAARPVAQPAHLGKADAPVGRVHREALHIGLAQADRVAAALELRVAAFLPEKALEGAIERTHHVLQRVHRHLGKIGRLRGLAPGGDPLAHAHEAGILLATLASSLLLGQGEVPHLAAAPRPAS
ncbi:hypothetical protein TMEC54S_00313 [Thauera mechernichensis]